MVAFLVALSVTFLVAFLVAFSVTFLVAFLATSRRRGLCGFAILREGARRRGKNGQESSASRRRGGRIGGKRVD